MQKLLLIISITILFVSCNADKKHALQKIKAMDNRVDSITNVYQSIDWDSYKKQHALMRISIDFISENINVVSSIDSSFIEYYGPYSGSAKVLSRAMKKQTKRIEIELDMVKTQILDLKHDVRKELIPNTDSINIFILIEEKALELINNDVISLQVSLLQQKKAYELTHNRVDSLISIAKQNL